jgi:hypothetical protein
LARFETVQSAFANLLINSLQVLKMKIVPQRSGKIIILTRDLTARQEIPSLLGRTERARELHSTGFGGDLSPFLRRLRHEQVNSDRTGR